MRGEGAYFIPDQKAARSTEPLYFTWLPNLHKAHDHLCSDHFFRSPVVCVVGNGFYAALVPDLDLRVIDGLAREAPRLSYGICPTVFDGHVYTRHPEGYTEPATVRQILEQVGERTTAPAIAPARSPPLDMNGQQLASPEGVFKVNPELEFYQSEDLVAEAGRDLWTHPAGADAEPIPELEFDQTLGL